MSYSRTSHRSFTTTRCLWLFLMVLVGFFFSTGNVMGQVGGSSATGSATAGLLSDRVSRQLIKAQNYSDNNQYKKAQKLLEKLVTARLNDYEAAVVYQSLGYAYAAMEDYPNTALAFEKSLSYGVLSKLAEQSLRLNLGQIYIAQDAYAKGTEILGKWLALEQGGTSQVYELLAVGFYHLDNFDKAEFYLNKAMATTNRPNKSWYQMLVAVNFAQSDYHGASEVLQTAIQYFPKEALFWQQLSYAYRQLEEDERALATLILANYLGLLDRDQSVLLAKYFAYQNMPTKAAQLVRDNIDRGKLDASEDNLLLLARSWLQAREPGQAAAILKSLCANAPDGKLHVFYAEVLTELRDWTTVVDTLTAGLKKGGIENTGQAHLLLGIAYLNLEQFSQAQQAFDQAMRDKRTKVSAGQWLDQIKRMDKER